MSIMKRSVSVYKVPAQVSQKSRTELLNCLSTALESGHARFVLDCSQMSTFGPEELHLLLCCLEEAMKHKGDVRLAHLGPDGQAILATFGAERLFEVFDTSESAVCSYEAPRRSSLPSAA